MWPQMPKKIWVLFLPPALKKMEEGPGKKKNRKRGLFFSKQIKKNEKAKLKFLWRGFFFPPWGRGGPKNLNKWKEKEFKAPMRPPF